MKKKGVSVDIEKLSHGLKTTFLGVAEVFESIGADEIPGFGVVGKEKSDDEAADVDGMERTEAAAVGDTKPTDAVSAEVFATAGTEAAEAEESPDATIEDGTGTEPETKEEAAHASQKASSLTVDDLIKVAAQKIKLKKGNSDKIGALVKAYGQTTLKDLPPEKYEAFMTDLAQI